MLWRPAMWLLATAIYLVAEVAGLLPRFVLTRVIDPILLAMIRLWRLIAF